MKNKVFYFVLMLVLTACSKEENQNENFIIFGHSYGECIGPDCVKVFKLTDTSLYFDIYAKERKQGKHKYVELENSEFIKARELWELFPSELLTMPDTTFGCPDCRDQGALILQYSNAKKSWNFSIDQDKDELPTYLHPYVDKVNQIISIIKVK
jgi:hypothetical protein